jgi:hypothetical protein
MRTLFAALGLLALTSSASMAATCYGRYGPYYCHVYHPHYYHPYAYHHYYYHPYAYHHYYYRPYAYHHPPPVVVVR